MEQETQQCSLLLKKPKKLFGFFSRKRKVSVNVIALNVIFINII